MNIHNTDILGTIFKALHLKSNQFWRSLPANEAFIDYNNNDNKVILDNGMRAILIGIIILLNINKKF